MSQSEATTETLPRSPFVSLAQWFLVIGIVLAVVAVGMSWLSGSVEISSPITTIAIAEPADGTYPAPDFRLASLDGGMLGPPDFAGDVVLVEFWATWCGPCRLQAQYLEEIHREMADKGVHFLAVDVGEDVETVRNYVEKTPFPYPVLLDQQDALSAKYQIYGLPTVMVINREGQITFLETGVSKPGTLRDQLVAAGASV